MSNSTGHFTAATAYEAMQRERTALGLGDRPASGVDMARREMTVARAFPCGRAGAVPTRYASKVGC